VLRLVGVINRKAEAVSSTQVVTQHMPICFVGCLPGCRQFENEDVSHCEHHAWSWPHALALSDHVQTAMPT
jgi:hypothetical protein